MDFSRGRGSILITCILVLFLFNQGVALGDIIHRKNGPPLEGKIISETATKVVLKMALGKIEIKKSDIVRIERQKTKKEEFKDRLKALKFTDIDGLKELAIWAEDNGLKSEAKKVYKRILRLDPDDKFANRALGKEFYKGKWYTRSELEKIKREEKKASSSKTRTGKTDPGPEDPKPDRKRRDNNKTQGRISSGDIGALFEQKLGEKPVVVSSEHFRIITVFEEDEAKALLELAEKIHEDFTEMIEEREGHRYWNMTADEFIVSSRGMYVDFVDKIMSRYVNSKAALDFWKRPDGGGLINSFPPVGAGVRKNSPLRNRIAHHAAHFLLRNYVGPRRQLKPWLTEGFAEYIEFKYEKAARVHCITRKQYGGDTKLANKASDSSSWAELVKTSVIDETHTPFEKLKHVMLNELDFEHLSKSWSLMTFLIDEHEDKFIEWVHNMRKMQWEEAMFKAYHWTNAELDKEWGLWVKATY